MTSPETAAAPTAVEGRGRDTPRAAPATPRTWTLPPITGPRMTANDRPAHFAVRARTTRHWRTLAWAEAKRAGIPPLARARILIEWLPYDRRRRDPANAAPMGKACVDGIVDAGVLPDDDDAHLEGPRFEIGKPTTRPAFARVPQTTLQITVTEATG